MKNRTIHLSLLIFFQLAAIGTYLPIMTIYLKDYLGFTSIQAGIILSLSSIPSTISPFLSALIVDRIISSRRFLAICTIITSLLIIILSVENSYIAVLITYFVYMLFLVPTLALVHGLIFHFIEDRNSFAFIRSWGTVGWILAGWFISWIWNYTGSIKTLPLALQVSAVLSLIVIFLTLKLPKIEINREKNVTLIPKETFDVIKQPQIILIFIIVFLSSTADKFYSYGSPIFLNLNGIQHKDMLVILSYGQIPEIVFLFLLTYMVKRFGIIKIMITAFVLQISRFFIFYINSSIYLTIFGTLFHGFIYPLFYAPATIYLDKFTTTQSRSGVHQIYNLIFMGLAGLTGNFLAGIVAENFTINKNIDFTVFWMVPGGISITAFILLLVFLRKYKLS